MNARIESVFADASDEFFLYLDDDIFYAASQHDMVRPLQREVLARDIGRFLAAHAAGRYAASLGVRTDPLQRRFEVMAQTYPGAPAVRCGSRVLSYGELDVQADALALHLQHEGLPPGSFCLLDLAPSFARVRTTLAVLKAGAVCLQCDPALPSWQRARMVDVLQPALLFARADDAAAVVDGAMRLVRCADEPEELPHGWPDEAAVWPGTPAHAYATLSSRGGIRMSMRTHRALGASINAVRVDRPLPAGDSEPARFWQVLAAGETLTIA
jgi:non-ribosomal peptide synthetase component F